MSEPTVSEAKVHLRVDGGDDDLLIQLLLDAACAELAAYTGVWPDPLPADLQLAVLDQVAFQFDNRGEADVKPGLVPAAARICARYKPVRVAVPVEAIP